MNGIEAITAEHRGIGLWWIDSEQTSPSFTATSSGELVKAAQCFITAATNLTNGHAELVFKGKAAITPRSWPWDAERWMPSLIAKNNLKMAGALIAMEWDRLDRLGL